MVKDFINKADTNKDKRISLDEGKIWFKHAWETPSGRKLLFNFVKSFVSIVGCMIAMLRMGYEDPALFWLFATIAITNLGMLSDASNETDMLNLLYSLVDTQEKLNTLQNNQQKKD